MSKLTESNKPTVHNILWAAGFEQTSLQRHEFKKTAHYPGEWVEYQNYYVALDNVDEWYYNKPQRKGDDICAFGDYSPEGLEKLKRILATDPTESE